MDVDIALSPSRERALDHMTVHTENIFCALDASPQNSKIAKGLEVVVTEITELQCELEATELDTNLSSDEPKCHELKGNYGVDELIYADADVAVEDGVSEEAMSSKSGAATWFMEEEEDLQEVEGKDLKSKTAEIVDRIKTAEYYDEAVENLKTMWTTPGKWYAVWLEQAAYWDGRGGFARPYELPELEERYKKTGLRRVHTI